MHPSNGKVYLLASIYHTDMQTDWAPGVATRKPETNSNGTMHLQSGIKVAP